MVIDSDKILHRVKQTTSAKSQMERGIHSAIRGLWSGQISRTDFVMFMESSLRRGLRSAWAIGAERAGILENELTEEELRAREMFISRQFSFVPGLADDIEANPKGTGKLGTFFTRAEMWVNRFDDALNQAFKMASGNKKLRWVRNPTSKSCGDCLRYDGRVHRAKIWGEIRPQHPSLACSGIRCHCSWVETDEPCLPGFPPAMTGG